MGRRLIYEKWIFTSPHSGFLRLCIHFSWVTNSLVPHLAVLAWSCHSYIYDIIVLIYVPLTTHLITGAPEPCARRCEGGNVGPSLHLGVVPDSWGREDEAAEKEGQWERGLQSHQGKEVLFSGSCFMIEKCSSVSQLHLQKMLQLVGTFCTAQEPLLTTLMTNMGKESKQRGYLYNLLTLLYSRD